MLPDARRDGEKIGAGVDQRPAVLDSDATDGNAWRRHDLAPPSEDGGIGAGGRLLGRGRVERSECDIIGSSLGGFHGEVAGVVARHADNSILSDQAPGFPVRPILLTDVNAIAIQFVGKIGTIVQNKGDVALLNQNPKLLTASPDGVVVAVLEPELHRSDVARVESRCQR